MPLHLIEVPALRIDSGYAAVFFKNEVKLGAAFQIEFWFRPDQIARPGFVPVLDMQFAIPAYTVYVWFGLLDGEASFGVYPDGGYAGQSFPLEQKKWCHGRPSLTARSRDGSIADAGWGSHHGSPFRQYARLFRLYL